MGWQSSNILPILRECKANPPIQSLESSKTMLRRGLSRRRSRSSRVIWQPFVTTRRERKGRRVTERRERTSSRRSP